MKIKAENNAEVIGYTDEEKAKFEKCKHELQNACNQLAKYSIKVALALYPIYTQELYRIDKFDNIYQFAKDTYNISRGTTHEFLRVAKECGVIDENGEIQKLKPEYSKYSISQLKVLSEISPEYREMAKPDMTVKQLKGIKNIEKNAPAKSNDSEKLLSQNKASSTAVKLPEYSYDTYEEFRQHENDIQKGLEDFKQMNPDYKFTLRLSVVQV